MTKSEREMLLRIRLGQKPTYVRGGTAEFQVDCMVLHLRGLLEIVRLSGRDFWRLTKTGHAAAVKVMQDKHAERERIEQALKPWLSYT